MYRTSPTGNGFRVGARNDKNAFAEVILESFSGEESLGKSDPSHSPRKTTAGLNTLRVFLQGDVERSMDLFLKIKKQ